MSRTQEFTAPERVRLDQFLAQRLTAYSRSKLQRLVENGHATVDDMLILEGKYLLLPGQTVRFREPEPDPDFPRAEKNPVRIVHEEDSFLVVDKPEGMVVHPNTFQDTGTLVQALLVSHPDIKEALYDPGSAVSRLRPGIVHRLDRDTSGLLVVAKTRAAMLNLSEQFHKRTVMKEYETLLYGRLREPRTVAAPIQRKTGQSGMMVASHDPGQGRSAVTHFTPVETYAPYPKWPEELATRTRVHIETGRTHQIRVHAKFIGHPVLGDQLYGNKPSQKLSERLGLIHQQLRAVTLSFAHPDTGQRLTFAL